jgi:tellurite resistance protein TehA-like permease
LHGLWNGSVLTTVYGSLRLTLSGVDFKPISILAVISGLGLLGITFFSILILLPVINWRLRLSLPIVPAPAAGNDIIAPLTSQPERNHDGLDSQSN